MNGKFPWRAATALALLLPIGASGCSRGGEAPVTETAASLGPELDEYTFPTALRAYHRLPIEDAQREAQRAQLLRYLEVRGAVHVDAADYDGAVSHMADVTSLYTPTELGEAPPPSLSPVAEFIRRKGERRGDEGRVLSALWLLKSLHPEDAALAEEYAALLRWSDEVRRDLTAGTEHLNGVIEVLEEHARLMPASAVLEMLADRYTERRRKLAALLGARAGRPPKPGTLSFQAYREATYFLSRAHLDIAAVYLLHDDPAAALARLRALEALTGMEPRLRTDLEVAISGGERAGDALHSLAARYADVARSDISVALCRRGTRVSPKDARFPRCLGQLAAAHDDYVEATYAYGAAIRLAPDDRSLYDEALEVLANMLRDGLFDTDPTETRVLAKEAEQILVARMERWPDAAPPVAPEDLQLAVGMAEMSAGNTQRARRRFAASLEYRETVRALLQAGLLEARLGKLDRAAVHLRRALDLTPQRSIDEARQRAQVLEYLGDVMRSAGEPSQAGRLYGEALALWDSALQGSREPGPRSAMHTRRGVLLERLGRRPDALKAYELAMEAAPDDRETYAQILSHMVVGAPEPELARTILRRAQRQLTLDPEWKTYFALWVQTIGARAGAEPLPDVEGLLERLSKSDAWWGKLAQFGRGTIDHKELRGAASNRGERTEADFYQAAKLLAAGDEPGARALFKSVIETEMVSFYEYQMAMELLLPPAK